MLQDIRKSTSSFVMKLLLGLLSLSFVMFYGYSSTTGCNPSGIAKVNGVIIQRDEYMGRLRSEVENYKRLLRRDLDDSMFGLVQKNVLDRLIDRVLIRDVAGALGLGAGDDAVRSEIERSFTDPKTGKFDGEFYKNLCYALHAHDAKEVRGAGAWGCAVKPLSSNDAK